MFSNDIYSHLQPYIFFEYRIPNESRDITGKNLSTTSFPPRILLLHLPTSFTDKYGVHEMLHVNEADKRRLMAGSVTIQELSRRSWWTPCLVVKNSRKIIQLPGTGTVHLCIVRALVCVFTV